ncbi:hypothetical protein CIB48_g5849 [Xylaria polymorpha]|nr:hypothetical protein CIB48_g5849 [Xylaria polymorpha]
MGAAQRIITRLKIKSADRKGQQGTGTYRHYTIKQSTLRSKRNPGFSPRDTVSLGPTTRRLERCSLAVGIASRQRVRLDQESGTLATSLSLSLYLDLDLDLDLDSGQHDEPVAM